ncbi:MAG: protein phosphatase 2C domain-containing protein, partial [Polyangiaceae bacterium]|nr:protein phosphatase 2C domain-containing protein [Polyangiaceae bacterium]
MTLAFRGHRRELYVPTAYGRSHMGRRERNEDAYCVMPHLGLFAVADGMGGQAGGEVASRIVVSSLVDFFERLETMSPADSEVTDDEDKLDLAIRGAHQRIVEQAEGALSRMGSTV